MVYRVAVDVDVMDAAADRVDSIADDLDGPAKVWQLGSRKRYGTAELTAAAEAFVLQWCKDWVYALPSILNRTRDLAGALRDTAAACRRMEGDNVARLDSCSLPQQG